MSSVSDRYVKLIYQRYKYFASWLPNTKVLLGDVGVVEGKYFKRRTTLRALGVGFTKRTGKKPMSFNDDLTTGLQVHAKTAGELGAGTAMPVAQAGVSIDFSSEGAFIFHALKCYEDEIEDKVAVGKALVRLCEKGNWDVGWSVVDTVVRAGNCTILLSNSRNSKLELKAKTVADISNLAKPELGLKVISKRGDLMLHLAEQGLTPLFRLSAFHRSWAEWLLGKPGTIHFGGRAGVAKRPILSQRVLQSVVPDLS